MAARYRFVFPMRERLARAAVALVAFAGPAVGCAGGSDPEPPVTAAGPPPALPACAKGEAVPPPDGFPAEFPLPPGTVVTAGSRPHAGQLVLAGLVPADLQDAASFFNESLPASGYRQGLGDSESNEAEAPFTGNGFRGKWKVNAIPGCPAAVALTLVLIRQS
jgi:hypothetical protein